MTAYWQGKVIERIKNWSGQNFCHPRAGGGDDKKSEPIFNTIRWLSCVFYVICLCFILPHIFENVYDFVDCRSKKFRQAECRLPLEPRFSPQFFAFTELIELFMCLASFLLNRVLDVGTVRLPLRPIGKISLKIGKFLKKTKPSLYSIRN